MPTTTQGARANTHCLGAHPQSAGGVTIHAIGACLLWFLFVASVSAQESQPQESSAPKSQPPAPETSEWQIHPVGTIAGVDVSLHVRSQAGPADRDWISLRFERNGEEWPELFCSYVVNALEIADATGERRHRGSGGQEQFRIEEVDPAVAELRRTDALRDGMLNGALNRVTEPVTAFAKLYVRVHQNSTDLSLRVEGLPFSFRWIPPDAEDLEAMRGELRERFVKMRTDWGDHFYAVSAHLERPEVASALTVEELVQEVLDPESTVYRDIYIRHLLQRDREALLSAYAERLEEGDREVLRDLHSGLWDDRFIPSLLKMHREDPVPLVTRWPAEAFVGHPGHDVRDPREAHLFVAPFIEAAEALAPPVKKDGWVAGGDRWKRFFRTLGGLGDPTAISFLESYLEDERLVVDPESMLYSAAPGAPVADALRMCDHAHDAILRILERDNTSIVQYFEQAGARDRRLTLGGPGWQETLPKIFAVRDELIERLKERLLGLDTKP